ncbi:MAG: aminoacetone oxidase family FAD-binding enzyme [Ruminiclostridium sp.]|nr:aminoacetone oxidase family FAD-binding enzyme [Ruminiclostridium sp.]
MNDFDIAVIGGGASGLAAAITAKRNNPSSRIVILERLSRIGKKILATGNGRCNYTNRNIDITDYHGSCRNLYNSIKDFSCEEFFETLGVYGYSDDEFRVYPLNNNASAILDGLRLEILKLGIDVICDFNVTDIKKEKKYRIISENDFITATSVIIAGGGMSQANLGSDGSMIRIMKKMGLSVSPLYPALTSIKVNPESIRSLKGIRTNAVVSLFSDNKKLDTQRGEVQFGDGTISGICVFNLSCLAGGKDKLELSIDMLPDINYNEAKKLIHDIRKIRASSPLEDYLSGILNKRIGMNIIKSCTSHALTEKAECLTEKELNSITASIKDYRFKITGLSGFEKSQVTAGGLSIVEMDSSLRSKKFRNMYFCGEILDIIGYCGGYNLYFAFGSGALAGKTCAEDLFNDKGK